ncbi:hypothetical protein [Pedobacter frigiditerrae]|uniref:hypothetical protein n=1 Tax=Pedobacter frigiditerrae TaxID=2530452 RepID=UPI00292EC20D|nr:hypothetical protein [Pedobacter frigiditerrae]
MQTTRILDEIETGDIDEPALARVTYVTEAFDALNNATAVGGKTSNDTKSSPAIMGAMGASHTYQLPNPFYYEKILFTDSTETITGLRLKTVDGSIPDKIILGLTLAEQEALLELITLNSLSNARMFLVDLFEDGNELISAENIIYQKYRAGIVGEKETGKLELFMPEDDVMVYSLDRKYHFTDGYGMHMPEYLNVKLALDLDIAL